MIRSDSFMGVGCMLTWAGVAPSPGSSVHSFGFLSGLLLESQAEAVAREAYDQLRQVCQLLPFLNERDLAVRTGSGHIQAGLL